MELGKALKMIIIGIYNDFSGRGNSDHSSILAWKIQGQRSLVGCSPWGCKKSDMTQQLSIKDWVFILMILLSHLCMFIIGSHF